MKRPELIPDWRSAWRYLSVQLSVALTFFGLMPEKQQAAILDMLGAALEMLGVPSYRIVAVVGVIGIVVRLLAQKRSLTQGSSDSGATKGEER